MDVNIYGAVMPHMLDDAGFGMTTAVAGTVGSWTTFGMLVGALLTGNDHRGHGAEGVGTRGCAWRHGGPRL